MGVRTRDFRVDPESASTFEGFMLGLSAVTSGHAINRMLASEFQHPSGLLYIPKVPQPAADSGMLRNALDQNQEFVRRIEALERQLAEIQDALGASEHEPRKITKAQAKREIRSYFKEQPDETVYPSDVAIALGLEYDFVVGVIETLEREGRIAKAE